MYTYREYGHFSEQIHKTYLLALGGPFNYIPIIAAVIVFDSARIIRARAVYAKT